MTAVTVRRMEREDVETAEEIRDVATTDLLRRNHEPPPPAPSSDRQARWLRVLRRFVDVDGPGCHVAEVDGEPAGMAIAIRRGSLWGLSLLFVRPDHQGRGVGRALMNAALAYADGAAVRMIMSSEDSRAITRYARAGLDLHPGFTAAGTVRRGAVPRLSGVRPGSAADLDLVDAVDTALRGSSRGQDLAYLLGEDAVLYVIDGPDGRGYAAQRDGRPLMLGADTVPAARTLLWRLLADADDEIDFWALTSAQTWTVDIVLDAGLRIRPSGPFFVSGMPALPAPYLPSGIFF